MAARPWQPAADGVTLAVRLTPRGGREGLDGVQEIDGQACLRVRVTAPPVEGAANAALVAWLAKALGLRRSDISLVAGERGRIKRLHLRGEGIGGRLEALLAG
jgi:uncharacterized protein